MGRRNSHVAEYVRHNLLSASISLPLRMNVVTVPIILSAWNVSFCDSALPSPRMVMVFPSIFIILCSMYVSGSNSTNTTCPFCGGLGDDNITLSRRSSKNGRMLYPRTTIVTLLQAFLRSSCFTSLKNAAFFIYRTFFCLLSVILLRCCLIPARLLRRGDIAVCVQLLFPIPCLWCCIYSCALSCRISL